MSNINLNWLTNNISNPSPIIFDIGAADLTDSITFKNIMPSAELYAFECAEYWKPQNLLRSEQHNINYFHMAISDVSGFDTFYPSETLKDQKWPWSGSTCKPTHHLLTNDWVWGDQYTVPCITLNDFCETNNIIPDFIHIDAQGAEYKIFKHLKKEYKPRIIWSEISEFGHYDTKVTYNLFCNMMRELGYIEYCKDGPDSLFIISGEHFTEYTKTNNQ